jgi:hypothetical protein
MPGKGWNTIVLVHGKGRHHSRQAIAAELPAQLPKRDAARERGYLWLPAARVALAAANSKDPNRALG